MIADAVEQEQVVHVFQVVFMLLNMVGQQGLQGLLFGFGGRGGGKQSESVRLGKRPRAIAADIDEIQVRGVFRRPLTVQYNRINGVV